MKQHITHRKNTNQIKTYRETIKGKVVYAELYNNNEQLIYRFSEGIHSRLYYDNLNRISKIKYPFGCDKIYTYNDSNDAVNISYKYPNGTIRTLNT